MSLVWSGNYDFSPLNCKVLWAFYLSPFRTVQSLGACFIMLLGGCAFDLGIDAFVFKGWKGFPREGIGN